MSKTTNVLLLTDLHLRSDYLPGFLEAQVDTLLRLAESSKPDAIVINGDIFHKRNPRGPELLAFQQLLDKLNCDDIYVNRGNHDTIRKDGTSDTTLSLYSDYATIITDAKTCRIGGVDFDFIPHYEDEAKILQCLKKSTNPVFGHFGFDGCVSNGTYEYESTVRKSHFKNKLAFLGHIHKPKVYNNIHVTGTQYSNTFGEANAQKYFTRLLIRDGEIEVVRKPIDFGIRHIVGTLDEIEELNKKYNFGNFYTLLRVRLDNLDSYAETSLFDEVMDKYSLRHLEFAFEDILPKFESTYEPDTQIFSLNDGVIEQYLSMRDSVFSKEELLDSLTEIKTYEN
jgi:DNA repair exonuclease SbcCD nuclease subunit